MKRHILVMLFGLFLVGSFSQTYSGQLINKESGEAVAFANIGIIDRNIGTVSDAVGWFEIELINIHDKDSMCISCIGYLDKKYLISDFKNNESNTEQLSIELTPISYHLDEVLIRPINTRTYILGYHCDSISAYGNVFYSRELGTEMGVVIKLPRKKNTAYLKSFRFYVGEFTFDKFPVRLNIYYLKEGLPDKRIIREPIFIEITSAGEYIVDLSKYNITALGDFFVSLEYYRIPDDTKGKLVFCAVHNRKMTEGNSYFRWTSQGNWQSEMFDHVGFSVEIECID